MTNGMVTSIGLLIRPSAKQTSARLYQTLDLGLWTWDGWTYFAYASSVSMKNKVLNTSFRSATHATDSTWSGCNAKKAATRKLRPCAPVTRLSQRKSKPLLAACRSKFTQCGPAAPLPNSVTSSMCETQVSGCQLLA